MAVRIRMKKMGRRHRPFFRICAVDSRKARDGRVLEELGTYDPMVGDTDARAVLKTDRIAYWLGVGAQPSLKVSTLIKKYGADGTHVEQQTAAREKLSMARVVPEAGAPVYPPSPEPAEPAAEAPAEGAAEAPPAEAPAAETPETPASEAPAEAPAADAGSAGEKPADDQGESTEKAASASE